MTAEKPLRAAGPSTSGNVRSVAQRVVVGLEVLGDKCFRFCDSILGFICHSCHVKRF